ncbi:MAG: ABC transporter ATP-binding protein [Clostridia bacterium]|nr:ABC transporter ATP-binding protein [Clostridia bacterium]
MGNDNILTLSDISYFYKDGDARRYILKDLNFEFERGKFYTILGESGSGKTTLLSLISALDKPQAGRILFEGKDINETGAGRYRRNNVGIVFQGYNLIPYMTACENVLVAMSVTDRELPKNKRETAYNLLNFVGIGKEKADRPVTKLSGGEQQRVAIARAVSTDVDLILADEPTGNLDEEKQGEIVGIFSALAHDFNKCIIAVTHSRAVAERSDVIVLLKHGELNTESDMRKGEETPDGELLGADQ